MGVALMLVGLVPVGAGEATSVYAAPYHSGNGGAWCSEYDEDCKGSGSGNPETGKLEISGAVGRKRGSSDSVVASASVDHYVTVPAARFMWIAARVEVSATVDATTDIDISGATARIDFWAQPSNCPQCVFLHEHKFLGALWPTVGWDYPPSTDPTFKGEVVMHALIRTPLGEVVPAGEWRVLVVIAGYAWIEDRDGVDDPNQKASFRATAKVVSFEVHEPVFDAEADAPFTVTMLPDATWTTEGFLHCSSGNTGCTNEAEPETGRIDMAVSEFLLPTLPLGNPARADRRIDATLPVGRQAEAITVRVILDIDEATAEAVRGGRASVQVSSFVRECKVFCGSTPAHEVVAVGDSCRFCNESFQGEFVLEYPLVAKKGDVLTMVERLPIVTRVDVRAESPVPGLVVPAGEELTPTGAAAAFHAQIRRIDLTIDPAVLPLPFQG